MIEVYQCNDLLVRKQILDDTGVPLRLTGAYVSYTVGRFGETAFTKHTGDGIDVTDPEEGHIEIKLTHEDTDLPSGEYRTELMIVDADGNRYTADQGVLRIMTSLHHRE